MSACLSLSFLSHAKQRLLWQKSVFIIILLLVSFVSLRSRKFGIIIYFAVNNNKNKHQKRSSEHWCLFCPWRLNLSQALWLVLPSLKTLTATKAAGTFSYAGTFPPVCIPVQSSTPTSLPPAATSLPRWLVGIAVHLAAPTQH